jgi:hypothetical protein
MDCLSENEILFGLVEGTEYDFWGKNHTFAGYYLQNGFLCCKKTSHEDYPFCVVGLLSEDGDLSLHTAIYPNGNLTITKVS